MSETTPAPAGKPDPVMAVLSYLGILALIPLFVKKDDPFIQWHAKQGLVFFVVCFAAQLVLFVLASVTGIGLLSMIGGLIGLVFLVVAILCIIKAINGDKFEIPVVSGFIGKVPTP